LQEVAAAAAAAAIATEARVVALRLYKKAQKRDKRLRAQNARAQNA
jgi:hypothetical protein